MSQVEDELPPFYRFVIEVKREAFAEHSEGCEYRGEEEGCRHPNSDTGKCKLELCPRLRSKGEGDTEKTSYGRWIE